MNIIVIRAAAGLAALAVAGCSSGPEIAVTSSGTVPTSGTYAIVESAPRELDRAISDLLARRGLKQSESPHYLIQVGYAERPAGTGLLAPHDAGQEWLRQPDPYNKKRLVGTLGVSVADATDGRHLYRASASGRAQAKRGEWAHLLQAILSAPASDAD